MKKNLLLLTLLLSTITLSAKNVNKESESIVTGFYDRSAYSFIIVDSEKEYSDGTLAWRANYQPVSHLDYNNIDKSCITSEDAEKYKRQGMNALFNGEKIGQQVVSYLFNRQKDGTYDDSIVRGRGLYNARTVDEQVAGAMFLGKQIVLEDMGYELINKNHILIVRMFDVKNEPLKDGYYELWGDMVGEIYHIDINETILNDVIFGSAMILPEDSEEVKSAKMDIFNALEFDFKLKTTVKVELESVKYHQSDKQETYVPRLYNKLYNELLAKIDRKSEIFNVQAPILSTKPIEAEVGAKESVQNNMRFDSYKFVLKNGKIKTKRTAVLRATSVAENREDNALVSEFLPIAGYGIKEGYVLKQNRDLESRFSPYYHMGALEGYGAEYVMTGGLKSNGRGAFGGVYMHFMEYNITELNNGNEQYIVDNPIFFDEGDWFCSNFGLTFGWTQRFLRYFELGAILNVGADIISMKYDSEAVNLENLAEGEYAPNDSSINGTMSIVPRLQLMVNILYPFHIIAGVDYSLNTGGSGYKALQSVLNDVGVNRSGVGYTLGVSMSF